MRTAISMSLDDLRHTVGHEIACSEWLFVTQEHIEAFAIATNDRQWIHLDPERARRESPFGDTVAHGFLTLSLLSGFLAEAVHVREIRMAVNYGLNRVRFPSPVRPGSKIRARFTVASAKEIREGLEVVFSVVVEVQHVDKPACVAEMVIRYYA